jgi:hypothetical protein
VTDLDRRNLLAWSLLATVGAARPAFSNPKKTSVDRQKPTHVIQGALSGGGYVQGIDISPDGSTMLISYDGSNAWVSDPSKSEWENVFAQDRLPSGFRKWGQNTYQSRALNANAIVCAPSAPQRIYAIVCSSSDQTAMVWRSDDQCESWTDTGYRIECGTTTPRGLGPKLAVDPNNPDVAYISDNAGLIHRTFNGGTTWEIPSELSSLVINLTASTSVGPGRKVLTLTTVPEDIETANGYTIFVSNVSRRTSFRAANYVAARTATSVTLAFPIPAGTPGLFKSDTIAFGSVAGIVFDPASPVSGGRTTGIYIGWAYGASCVYHSTNAGASFRPTKGGPARIRRLACSGDGVIYACSFLQACGRETTAAGTSNAWKYQNGNWVNLPISGAQGNTFNACAADPRNPGHVAFVMDAGNIQFSGDYGGSWYSAAGVNPRSATDVPWLAKTSEDWQSQGAVMFDPVISGRLWIVEGIGVWYCTPPVAPRARPSITITSRNKNQQGLIVDQILKPPGQSLVVAVQDRAGLLLRSVTEEPTTDFGIGGISHGWAIDYAKDDPHFLALIVGTYLWISTDSGANWIKCNSQVPGVNAGGAVAVHTRQNMVWFPANNGTPGYTMDGGNTWKSCLFAESPLNSGWSFSMYLNRHIVVADLVDPSTYYAYNYSQGPIGGVWRSADGGATWTNVSHGLGALLATGSVDFQLIAIPGHLGHLMFGSGSAFNNNFPLMRSVDAGATWQRVTTSRTCWQVAAGKSAPGSTYPAVYISGTLSLGSEPGIFRSDDFTTEPGRMPSWTRLCAAPAKNMDTPKSLCADFDVYGDFYIGFGSTGYAYGRLID